MNVEIVAQESVWPALDHIIKDFSDSLTNSQEDYPNPEYYFRSFAALLFNAVALKIRDAYESHEEIADFYQRVADQLT